MTAEGLPRPPVLGAIADDDHAPHVVATVERLAALHDLRPLYVHACGSYLAAPVTFRVGDPYVEPPLPELTVSEAESAFVAWRGAQPLLAHAGVRAGREAYILAGGPPAIALRELARTLRATAIVVGRGRRSGRLIGHLAGNTALGLARTSPVPCLFVDDRPLPLEDGPIVCVLSPGAPGWGAQLRAAASFASRSGRRLELYCTGPPPADPSPQPAIEPTPLATDGDPAAAIAALAERDRAALLVIAQAPTPALRALLHGSLPVDLLRRPLPLMTCPPAA